jgi:hypothetical protein
MKRNGNNIEKKFIKIPAYYYEMALFIFNAYKKNHKDLNNFTYINIYLF